MKEEPRIWIEVALARVGPAQARERGDPNPKTHGPNPNTNSEAFSESLV